MSKDNSKLLKNAGMIEMERVISQLASSRACTRQDIVDFIEVLKDMVNDLEDKIVYSH
jgi:adenylylsulfate kinase-like enzyme